MADASSATVPLSRSSESGTPRQSAFHRDGAGTDGKTPSLKALAWLVIGRDGVQDTEQDNVSRSRAEIGSASGTDSTPAVAAPTCGEVNEERAALVEYEGQIPRVWAEGFTRFNPDRPAADVPPKRWQQFVDDVGRFLDGSWAEKASAFGWGPLDLFGCDRDRPFARIDHAGLLWLINGNDLVDLDHHQAVIAFPTGARQIYRRKPSAVGEVVLAWELSQ